MSTSVDPRAPASRDPRFRDQPPDPPKYPGAPIIGNAKALLEDPTAFLVGGHKRFGSVFSFQVLWHSFVVIAGQAAKVFMAEGLDERHLTRHPIFGPLEQEFGGADFVMAQSGVRHTRLRPPLAVAFSRQVASAFIVPLSAIVRDAVQRRPSGSRVSVTEEATRLAFAQWCQLIAPHGDRLRFRDCRRLSTYWMLVGSGLVPPLIFRAPWYRAAHRRTFAAFREMVREARQAGPPSASVPLTIVDALASARDSGGAPLTDDEIVTYLAYGTMGACAYVARLVAFMLFEIARDAALMEQLRAEVQPAFAFGVKEASDLRRMHLLHAVYQETLRRHPISPGMPFVVQHDFEHLGWRVRQGQFALVCPVPSSFSPSAFQEPERFDPARCRAPRNEHRKGESQPFGIGNRTCVAGGLVEVMATTIVGSLLAQGRVVMDPPSYTLALTVRPLPAPTRRLGIRIHADSVSATDVKTPHVVDDDERLVAFPGHDAPDVQAALARATLRRFPARAVIIREGDMADAYYLIQSGSAAVLAGDPPRHVADLNAGEGFGETGLVQNAPRNATVVAGPDGTDTLVLDRESFLAMIAGSDLIATEIRALMQRRAAANRLRLVAPGLAAADAARVLPDFTWVTYEAGQTIIREGDPAEHFFLLVEGTVEVSGRNSDGTDRVLAKLGPGDYFGELGLLHHAPRNATVKAGQDGGVTVLRTDHAGFDRLLHDTGPAGTALAQAMLSCAERLGQR